MVTMNLNSPARGISRVFLSFISCHPSIKAWNWKHRVAKMCFDQVACETREPEKLKSSSGKRPEGSVGRGGFFWVLFPSVTSPYPPVKPVHLETAQQIGMQQHSYLATLKTLAFLQSLEGKEDERKKKKGGIVQREGGGKGWNGRRWGAKESQKLIQRELQVKGSDGLLSRETLVRLQKSIQMWRVHSHYVGMLSSDRWAQSFIPRVHKNNADK